jgi:hypothetical protein
MQTTNVTQTLKSIWEKPEGSLAKWVLFGVLLGMGVLAIKYTGVIMGWFHMLLRDTFMAIVYGIPVVAVLAIILIPNLRQGFLVAFWGCMRWIAHWYAKVYPEQIIEYYISFFRNSVEQIRLLVGQLVGALNKIDRIIAQKKQEGQIAARVAVKARDEGNQMGAAVAARRMGRRVESIEEYLTLRNNTEYWIRVLRKLLEILGYQLEDIQDNYNEACQKKDIFCTTWQAIKGAVQLAKGIGFMSDSYRLAMENMETQLDQRKGWIENYMQSAQDFISNMDLEHEVVSEEALKKIDLMANDPDKLFLVADDKRNLLEAANDPNNVLQLDAPVALIPKNQRTTRYSVLKKS